MIRSEKNEKFRMSWRALLMMISPALVVISCARETQEPNAILYPEPQPDSLALVFLPGIVSTDTLDFNSAFSPDGRSFFFSRSSINKKWDIKISTFDGLSWSHPTVASFSEYEYAEADAVFGPNGIVYYISDRPMNESDTTRDFNIWFVKPSGEGSWSVPENLKAVNSDSSELYISFAANGNLYFASDREGGFGSLDIYVSKLIQGIYTKPENLGPTINAVESDHDPCVSSDEKVIFFTSVDRSGSMGQADIYYAVRENSHEQWQATQNLGSRINTETYEYCSYLTPDNKYFFFSSNYDVKWIRTDYLPVRIK